MTNKGDTETVSSNQAKSGNQNMFLKDGQYIFQNEIDEKMDESSAPFLKSVNKVVIPKDKSLYPGFPSTEG